MQPSEQSSKKEKKRRWQDTARAGGRVLSCPLPALHYFRPRFFAPAPAPQQKAPPFRPNLDSWTPPFGECPARCSLPGFRRALREPAADAGGLGRRVGSPRTEAGPHRSVPGWETGLRRVSGASRSVLFFVPIPGPRRTTGSGVGMSLSAEGGNDSNNSRTWRVRPSAGETGSLPSPSTAAPPRVPCTPQGVANWGSFFFWEGGRGQEEVTPLVTLEPGAAGACFHPAPNFSPEDGEMGARA